MPYKDPRRRREYQRRWRKKRRDDWLRENGPCSKCGSWDSLEIDHKDRSKKVDHKVWSWSKARREEELAKCQVLCEGCHKEKTAAEVLPPHGSNNRYTHRKRPCRCSDCRKAHAEANSRYR